MASQLSRPTPCVNKRRPRPPTGREEQAAPPQKATRSLPGGRQNSQWLNREKTEGLELKEALLYFATAAYSAAKYNEADAWKGLPRVVTGCQEGGIRLI